MEQGHYRTGVSSANATLCTRSDCLLIYLAENQTEWVSREAVLFCTMINFLLAYGSSVHHRAIESSRHSVEMQTLFLSLPEIRQA